MAAKKPIVRLAGVSLAANSPIAWRFQTGTQPYVTTMSVHESHWPRLQGQMGQDLTLEIKDSAGTITTIRNVSILHPVSSTAPHLRSFLVADRRWRWPYKLVARDYNIPKKTGDRTAKVNVPFPAYVTVDQYEYKAYSLDGDKRWTAKRALTDILQTVDPGAWMVESFPIEGDSEAGVFTLQNIALRDAGDVAIARLLGYIPGADVYVDQDGVVRVIDAADLLAAELAHSQLPKATWDGDRTEYIDRSQIRPSKVVVHYQRQFEMLVRYQDDYSESTPMEVDKDDLYLENVIPTVDPETEVTVFDPNVDGDVTKTVPQGTWIAVDRWLHAADRISQGGLEWSFDTIQRHWLKGDLDGVLGGRGLDLDPTGNQSMRIQALKTHFRQTFRINPRVMERLRDIQAYRIGVLDPVTGSRAPSSVWGQFCIVPTDKGKLMAGRNTTENIKVFRNVDPYQDLGNSDITDQAPSQAQISILDRDLGIFRVNWFLSPYGDQASIIPSNLVQEGDTNVPKVTVRDLIEQDIEPIGAGCKIDGGTNGIFLRDSMRLDVLMSATSGAPNDKRQFFSVDVYPSEVQSIYRTEFRIKGGFGPPLEVFVSPGEVTARFAWDSDIFADLTIKRILGLIGPTIGTTETEGEIGMVGFVPTNFENEIQSHSKAVAAEELEAFADSIQGRVASTVPTDGFRLVGNMSGASINVAPAPSGKVMAIHEFPGRQRPLSRFALMTSDARNITLGIVRLEAGDR